MNDDVNNTAVAAQDPNNEPSNIEQESPVVEAETNTETEQTEEQGEESPSETETLDKKHSQSVPYERFREVNERAKEADLYKQQVDFYKQQYEAMQNRQPQSIPEQEDSEIVNAKRILKDSFGLVDQDEVEKKIQEYDTNQRAINSVMQQESSLKQKLTGRNLPEVKASDLVQWYEARGHFVDKRNIPSSLIEDIYYLRYRDQMDSYYKTAQQKPAPTVQGSATSPGKAYTVDDLMNAPADKTDEIFRALKASGAIAG